MFEDGMAVPAPLGEQILNLNQLFRAVGDIPVGHVVENPAEGLEHGRIVAHLTAEEPACPEETLTAGGQNLFGLAEVVCFYQPHHLR